MLSPCKRSEQGGSKFNWNKKSTYPCIWCHRICLSVRPSVRPSVHLSVTNFDPYYLRTGKTEQAETFFRTSMAKSNDSKIICLKNGWSGLGRGPKQQHFDPIWNLPHKFHLYLIELHRCRYYNYYKKTGVYHFCFC